MIKISEQYVILENDTNIYKHKANILIFTEY